MPEGPFGGPRPFADSDTQVLLDITLSDPSNDPEFINIPESAPEMDEMKAEEIISEAGVNRRRIYSGRKMRTDGVRVVITYGDTTLSVEDAASISKSVRSNLDDFYRPIIKGSGQNPAPFTTKWKCSSVPSLVSGEDLQSRVERSAKRAKESINSGVSGPSGWPRPFANPDGLVIEYTLEITGAAIDTKRLESRILNMETGNNLPTHEKYVKVMTGEERGEIRMFFDEGSSGVMALDIIQFNREMPKRINRIEGVRMKSSKLRCGE